MNYPKVDSDPKTREQLQDWLDRREEQFPGEPLDAREVLMIQNLRGKRPPYSIT
jgi:hypothetical protein